MVTIVVKLEPAQEVTYLHTASLNLSVIPVNNFCLAGALPCSLTPGFKEAYLSTSEISWYTQGVTVWARASTNNTPIFDLELYNSQLIAAGLQIRISCGDIQPEILHFPPGSISTIGVRFRVTLKTFMNRFRDSQERSPHLFQSQYRNYIDSRLTQQNHQPLAINQRATSEIPRYPGSIREAERELNVRREEHLKSSKLF